MFISSCSQLVAYYSETFSNKSVLFSGDIEDQFPEILKTAQTKIHTQKYHYWKQFKNTVTTNIQIEYGCCATSKIIDGCNTLLYYWPKNKLEAIFHLKNLTSLLPKGSDIFIVGDNKSGVTSATRLMFPLIKLNKIRHAKHCKLYYGILEKNFVFNIKDFWNEFSIENTLIKSLPGVFGRHKLDNGSKLLLSTFKKNIKGNILDIGCGTGALSVLLKKNSPTLKLWLTDNHAAAIMSAKETLKANFFSGNIISSDLYSEINNKFDIIISNPPFHSGKYINFSFIKKIIFNSIKYLKYNGELRIVGNACLPYAKFLTLAFRKYEVLAYEKNFKVYRVKI